MRQNYIHARGSHSCGNGKIQKGDILICASGALGKVCQRGDLDNGAICIPVGHHSTKQRKS